MPRFATSAFEIAAGVTGLAVRGLRAAHIVSPDTAERMLSVAFGSTNRPTRLGKARDAHIIRNIGNDGGFGPNVGCE